MPHPRSVPELHALEVQMRALTQRGLSADDLIGLVAEEAASFQDVRDRVGAFTSPAAEDLDDESFL